MAYESQNYCFLFLKNCTLTPSNKFEFVLPIIADCFCTFSFLRSVKISLTKFLHYVVIKVLCLSSRLPRLANF